MEIENWDEMFRAYKDGEGEDDVGQEQLDQTERDGKKAMLSVGGSGEPSVGGQDNWYVAKESDARSWGRKRTGRSENENAVSVNEGKGQLEEGSDVGVRSGDDDSQRNLFQALLRQDDRRKLLQAEAREEKSSEEENSEWETVRSDREEEMFLESASEAVIEVNENAEAAEWDDLQDEEEGYAIAHSDSDMEDIDPESAWVSTQDARERWVDHIPVLGNSVGGELVYDFALREKDLMEHFIKGGGAGGQKINKTNSCVYLRHIPTNTIVKCQQTRSLRQNRKIARQILTQKLEELLLGKKSSKALLEQKIRKQKLKAKKRREQKAESSFLPSNAEGDHGSTQDIMVNSEMRSLRKRVDAGETEAEEEDGAQSRAAVAQGGSESSVRSPKKSAKDKQVERQLKREERHMKKQELKKAHKNRKAALEQDKVAKLEYAEAKRRQRTDGRKMADREAEKQRTHSPVDEYRPNEKFALPSVAPVRVDTYSAHRDDDDDNDLYYSSALVAPGESHCGKLTSSSSSLSSLAAPSSFALPPHIRRRTFKLWKEEETENTDSDTEKQSLAP